jgi:hypothetical protein
MGHTDKFVLAVISLAFALKKLVESEHYNEEKHGLVKEFTKLKNKVQFHINLLEKKEAASKYQQRSSIYELNKPKEALVT